MELKKQRLSRPAAAMGPDILALAVFALAVGASCGSSSNGATAKSAGVGGSGAASPSAASSSVSAGAPSGQLGALPSLAPLVDAVKSAVEPTSKRSSAADPPGGGLRLHHSSQRDTLDQQPCGGGRGRDPGPP